MAGLVGQLAAANARVEQGLAAIGSLKDTVATQTDELLLRDKVGVTQAPHARRARPLNIRHTQIAHDGKG